MKNVSPPCPALAAEGIAPKARRTTDGRRQRGEPNRCATRADVRARAACAAARGARWSVPSVGADRTASLRAEDASRAGDRETAIRLGAGREIFPQQALADLAPRRRIAASRGAARASVVRDAFLFRPASCHRGPQRHLRPDRRDIFASPAAVLAKSPRRTGQHRDRSPRSTPRSQASCPARQSRPTPPIAQDDLRPVLAGPARRLDRGEMRRRQAAHVQTGQEHRLGSVEMNAPSSRAQRTSRAPGRAGAGRASTAAARASIRAVIGSGRHRIGQPRLRVRGVEGSVSG